MKRLQVAARSAVRDVDVEIDVAPGEVLAVLGPNGAGKSTVLAMAAGLLRPDGGRVVLGDTVLSDAATGTFVPPHKRGIALLAQQAMLFPHLTVAANVGFGPRSRGRGRAASRSIADEWLRAVGVEHLAKRRPSQLSGGQAQRVAIARALAGEPDILLLDEPMAALDASGAPELRRLLREVMSVQRRTALLVTHDLLDALALADTAIVVEAGRIVERGDVRSVLTTPRSAFGARIAGVNLVTGRVDSPDSLQTDWGATIYGIVADGFRGAGVALFSPDAVAIHLEPPRASPRNVLPVTVLALDVHGHAVRVTGAVPNGPQMAADVTTRAVADLDLVVGQQVCFVVKAQEVRIHPAHT
ncbi:MAG TPA: ATP-binding cassette domain-containing protein [Aldersonia sp.]